jgi:recombinational DNA repair protein RecR
MSRTLEQAIIWYEKSANTCRYHNLTESQEEFEQLAAWLRELQERRKAPEIVRCGECEHFRKEHDGEMWCGVSKGHGIDKDFFCGDAERRTDG